MYAVLLFLSLALVAGVASKPAKSSKLIQQHLEDVEAFPCSVPQMRSFPLSTLDIELPNGYYSPPSTVLHRCDKESGCCKSQMEECGPKEEVLITRMFLVTTLVNDKPAASYHSISFSNHTLCGCQSKSAPPK